MSQFVVGLTGGIGTGKTTVANIFAGFGVDIIDADIIAREIVQPGTFALDKIIEHFGLTILSESGELDRAQLRKIIFNDKNQQLWLNQLLHPIIRQQMIAQSQSAQSRYCILAVPLLLENKLQNLVQRILITDCEPDTQIQRACQRDNNSVEQIKKIIATQLDRNSRVKYADDIINTELPLPKIKKICEKLHQNYLKLAN